MYKGYIYRHWHVINGVEVSYIGQTSRKLSMRWGKDGKCYTYGNGCEFGDAIERFGWDNFHHDILGIIECESQRELGFWLDEWEKYFIWYYDSYYNGYNSTLGGSSNLMRGYKTTNEYRRKYTGVRFSKK